MPGLQDIPGIEVHGKGQLLFTLPVGYVDSAGKVHDSIVLREMTGVEDDMLGNDDLPLGERVSSVLSACIVKLGDIENKDIIKRAVSDTLEGGGLPITEQDRIAAMIYLRRVSLGDYYKFERRCPRCSTNAENRTTDLRELKIKKCAHPERRRVKLKLTRSGKEVVIKVLSAQGSIDIGRLRPTQKDLKTLALKVRIELLDGKPLPQNPQQAISIIKDLPQADRNMIRQAYNAMEDLVETEIDVECRNPICMATWSFPLDVGQSFFLDLEAKVTEEDLNWL